MNGDRDVLHVSRSKVLRSSPPAYRKSAAKGCSPSKLPVCTNSLFSSSISKGQSMYSGSRGTRSAVSETLLLPASTASTERKRLVGGMTPTKRSAALTFPSVVEDGIVDDQQDFLLEPQNLEEEMRMIKGSSLSDESFYKRVPDSLRQPSCSEKVSKWLEESQHSTMTDLTENHIVSLDEELEVTGRGPCSRTTGIPEAYDYQDRYRLADILPESIPTAQSLVEVPIDMFKRFKGFSLARLLIGYVKVITCLSVVSMGFLLRIRPTSWEYYEPPPT